MKAFDAYIADLEKELASRKQDKKAEEVGYVQEVKDGVASLTGLTHASYGEIVSFESGVTGMIIDLLPEIVNVVVMGDYTTITAGQVAKATGTIMSVPVGEKMIGRVVNPLGQPVDSDLPIETEGREPIEKIAPGVITRKSVSEPLQTGIKAIDALIPVGRGQRQLIIGDRGTGKTTLAIDTILNQKDQDIICIYCAIGQKNSKTNSIIELLKRRGAMDYTIVVNASAADPASLQYIAPYSATAIGEYFLNKGKDVLVIYDDLTKHAYAYRQISLILRRPSGREAYPGDIFYLHSRLLERACRLNEDYGGGSLTALPFIETLENDVSAFIPTNVISITDGQIFLETDLFNSGVRPAINVGASVSRVGGSAQTKAMKQVAGKLKLDLAQYRDLAAFSQFESELDDETKKFLARGVRATKILKQDKYSPYQLAEEVAIIFALTRGHLDDVDPDAIEKFEQTLMEMLRTKSKDLMKRIHSQKKLEEKDEEELAAVIADARKLV